MCILHFQTCYEKEAVLHLEQNQVINLTAKYPYRELSGCYYTSYFPTTPSKKYTHNIPTIPYRTQTTKYLPELATTTASVTYVTENFSYESFDLSTTTIDYNFTEEAVTSLDDTTLDLNYTVSEAAEENTVTVSC